MKNHCKENRQYVPANVASSICHIVCEYLQLAFFYSEQTINYFILVKYLLKAKTQFLVIYSL